MKRESKKRRARRKKCREESVVRIGGLTLKQHAFVREKILGMSDKDAALAAGYATSVAKNTKEKIWSVPEVAAEFERLKSVFLEVWKKLISEDSSGGFTAETDREMEQNRALL
jgi:phage terminase small subunit